MGKQQWCLNCRQFVMPMRNYKNIYGRQNLGTFLFGKLRSIRCPICRGTNFSKSAPPPEPIHTKETVIKEVVLIPCAYCHSLMAQTDRFCSNCGARRKG